MRVCVYIYMCVLTAGDCPIGGEGTCLWRRPNLQFQECDSAQLATGSAESLGGGWHIHICVCVYTCVCVYIYMCVLTAGDCPIGGEGACVWRRSNLQVSGV